MTDEKNFLEQVYTSPAGKDVEIVKVENTALYAVQHVKGGTLPEEFEGMFTSPKHCKEAIDSYFTRVQEKLDDKKEYVAPEKDEIIGQPRMTKEEATTLKAKKSA